MRIRLSRRSGVTLVPRPATRSNEYVGTRAGKGRFTRKLRPKAYRKMRRNLRKAGRRTRHV